MTDVFFELLPAGLLQGLILSVVALGILVPFRLLNFPDLTAEGSYPLGGALCASLMIAGVHPVLATLIASFFAGALGLGTAAIHLKFRVNTLLAGIILSTMVYSVNLRLMGKPNAALFEQATLFTPFVANRFLEISFLLILVAVLTVPLLLFLRTEKGLRLRAVGLNPIFAQRQGIDLNIYILMGLFLGNALCGLAGSLMVQSQGYADIGMGVGIVIHALAALMIGESILGTQTLPKLLLAPLLGALIYQQIQGLALAAGLAPADLKLLTGAIVLGVLALRKSHRSI